MEPRAGEVGAGEILAGEVGPRQIVIGEHRPAPVLLLGEIAAVQLQHLSQFLGIELLHIVVGSDAHAVHRGIKGPDHLGKC